MDPKLSQLDPKLREAYERVMNSPSSPPPGGQSNAPQGPNPLPPHMQTPPPPAGAPGATLNHPNPVPPPPPHLNLDEVTLPTNPVPPPPPINPAPITPPPAFNAANQPNPAPMPNQPMAFNAQSGTNTFNANGAKKKSMLPILIGIAIPILLVVYTAVWIVVLDVKLPFLP